MSDFELTLIKYIPFLLNGTEEFIYKPKESIQLIIGSNGSGKTSLVRQLSPLPGESGDFAKGGMKIYKKGPYVLTSDFTKGGSGEHSFIMDGVELNEGKTLNVQKVLVEEKFGITKDIHYLLIGDDDFLFTKMSPSKRKEWLTRLSPSNFDFLINVFQKATVELKEKVGAIKHISGKLNNLANNEKADEEETIESVRKNVDQLQASIREHRDFKDSLLTNIPSYHQEDYSQLDNEINAISDSIITRIRKNISEINFPVDLNNVDGTLENMRNAVYSLESDINRINEKISKLEQYLEALSSIPEEDNKTTLAELKNQLPDSLLGFNGIDDFVVLSSCFGLTSTNVNYLYQSIAYNEKFNAEREKQLIEEEKRLESSKSSLLNEVDKHSVRLRRLMNAKEQACRKCGFHEHDTGEDINAIEELIAERTKTIHSIAEEVSHIGDLLQEIDDWKSHLRRLRELKDSSLILNDFFWREFLTEGIFKKSPGEISDFISNKRNLIVIANQYYRERKIAEDRLSASAILDSFDGMTKDGAIEMLSRLSKERSELFSKVDQYKSDINIIISHKRDMERSDELLEKKMRSIYAMVKNVTDSEINETLLRMEKAVGYQYTKLSELEGRKSLIEELTRSKEELELDIKTYELLCKKLSPNTGLIAKLLTSSINGVISNMNLIIDSIWTSRLEVGQCSIEGGKLDYRFPLLVKDAKYPAKDVKFGSAGQRDIIDFAFKVIVYTSLGIENYPLFLDEFGSTFDEQHRANATELIKTSVVKNNHPYVFFISHYYGQHGGLGNNETLVLDDANVSVPQRYNDHVTIR